MNFHPIAEQLSLRARDGDAGAAAELVRIFYQKIFAYFRRLTSNDHDAADLTQKTFLKVWAALGSFQQRSSFSTWLHGIAHHVFLDWLRLKGAGEYRPDAWWEAQQAPNSTPFQELAQRDLASHLYALVDQLELDTREVVHLHYYQELSLHETAEVLEIATSTVKYRLRKALDFLRARTERLKPAHSN